MAYRLNDINSAIRADAPGFLAQCDAAYQRKIVNAADAIARRMEQSPIILLSGPSGSGKTTTAMKIEEILDGRGMETHTVAMDNYFKTLDPETAPRTPEGEIDFESPELLDMELLDDHFTRLSRHEEVLVPHFDFSRQMRDPARSRPLRLGKNELVIFEGIHALGPGIAGRHPEATKLYISARSNVVDEEGRPVFQGVWMRLSRRTVRDHNFRGTSAAETLAMWDNVRRGEKIHIAPYKDSADILFDSAIPYEMSVMRKVALPLFEAVPHHDRGWLAEMISAFERFEPVDPALVAPDALLREFIGGGSYKYQ